MSLNDINHQFSGKVKRRKMLGSIGSMAIIGLAPIGACAQKSKLQKDDNISKIDYNLDDPIDRLQIYEKLRGDLSGKTTYSFSTGRVFGIRTDQKEDLNEYGKEVLRFTGCGMRIKRTLDDGSVETKSKNWLLYQDPESGEFVDELKNPYTSEIVKIPPFRGGISGGILTPRGPKINANFSMESTAIDTPLPMLLEFVDDRAHITRHAFTKWLEKKTNTYRSEMTLDTFSFLRSDLSDSTKTHIPSDSHWTSETSWLSILNMADTPGHMIWSTNGRCLFDKDALPDAFVQATEQKQPDIFAEPLSWSS